MERERQAQREVDVEREGETREARPGRRVTERRAIEGEAARLDVAAAMITPEECPMIEGATAAVVDLGDGAALEFIADDPNEVQIVRDRVLNMAVKHQRVMQSRMQSQERTSMRNEEHEERRGMERERHDEARAETEARLESDVGSQPEAPSDITSESSVRELGTTERRDVEKRREAAPEVEAGLDPIPASHVAVVDVDSGARLIFVPVERADLDELRVSLERRADHLREGTCPANLMSMHLPAGDIGL